MINMSSTVEKSSARWKYYEFHGGTGYHGVWHEYASSSRAVSFTRKS